MGYVSDNLLCKPVRTILLCNHWEYHSCVTLTRMYPEEWNK